MGYSAAARNHLSKCLRWVKGACEIPRGHRGALTAALLILARRIARLVSQEATDCPDWLSPVAIQAAWRVPLTDGAEAMDAVLMAYMVPPTTSPASASASSSAPTISPASSSASSSGAACPSAAAEVAAVAIEAACPAATAAEVAAEAGACTSAAAGVASPKVSYNQLRLRASELYGIANRADVDRGVSLAKTQSTAQADRPTWKVRKRVAWLQFARAPESVQKHFMLQAHVQKSRVRGSTGRFSGIAACSMDELPAQALAELETPEKLKGPLKRKSAEALGRAFYQAAHALQDDGSSLGTKDWPRLVTSICKDAGVGFRTAQPILPKHAGEQGLWAAKKNVLSFGAGSVVRSWVGSRLLPTRSEHYLFNHARRLVATADECTRS
jgi:hypothetical protein